MDTVVDSYLVGPDLNDFNYHLLQEGNFDDEFEDYRDGSSLVHESSSSGSGDSPPEQQGDINDPMLKFISQMLMEEDHLENQPCMFHDCLAAQAAEKSFYDVLNDPSKSFPYVSNQENTESPTSTSVSQTTDSSYSVNQFSASNLMVDQSEFNPYNVFSSPDNIPQPNLQQFTYTNSFLDAVNEMDESLMSLVKKTAESRLITHKFSNPDSELKNNTLSSFVSVEEGEENALLSDSIDKKNHAREDDDSGLERRSNKLLASYGEESVTLEMYDNVLLSHQENPHLDPDPSSDDALKVEARNKLIQMKKSMGTRRRPRIGKRSSVEKVVVVDLRNLLLQCAQSIAINDNRSTNELLKQIRDHSSPHGDGEERTAYYLANALEARLAGTGTAMYQSFNNKSVTAAEILPSYKVFLTACPFKKLSSMFANRIIEKLAAKETRLHIIDFGILYGFQWPCFIQRLSNRPGGPPILRVTGIDLPQSGFKPAGRVEETGQRLAKYCQRFNVPFEYTAIAKKWDTIRIEDFKINNNELLVVNCLDRLSNIPDETTMVDDVSPRDKVLKLIRRLNPALFILGVANGTYNSPFFVTRFREALFHFSAQFDMFESTVPQESRERAMYEQEVIARDALNVIACEGTERVNRPETYKQWQGRTVKAGFKQIPLDKEIQKLINTKLKLNYHKDFSVDEDKYWVLQGWKGRVGMAVSSWVPV